MLQVAEEIGERDLLFNHGTEVFDLHALLRHVVAVAYGDAAVVQRIVVHGYAERRSNGVLAAIALSNRVFLVVLVGEVVLELVYDLLGQFRQAVLLHQRHYGHLDGSQRGGNLHYNALLAIFQLLYRIGVGQHGQAHTVYTDGRLDNIGSIGGILLRIKVFDLFAGELLMVAQVEVGTAVNAFQFLEAEGEVELDIRGGVGVMGQLLVVVETVIIGPHSQVYVPFHAGFLPLFEPVQLGAGLDEELHLHLLELAHAEDKLAGHNLVAEGLSDLGDTERNLHPAGLLDVQIVHKNALGGLRTQINEVGAVGRGAHGGGEHQVKLTHLGPVASTGNGAHDVAVDDNLAIFGIIVGLFGSHITVVYLVIFGLFAQHIGVCSPELGLVKGVSELLFALSHLFFNLFLDLAQVIFDEDIGPVALLGIFVVDEGVVEGSYVSGGLPDARVHENSGVNAHDILIQAGHGLPPIVFDVVFELDTHLAIVINGCQTVVNLAGREDKAILLAVSYQHFK